MFGKWIGVQELTREFGVSKSAIYKWIRDRGFPAPKIVIPGTTARFWDADEVRRWLESFGRKRGSRNADL